MRRFGTKAVPGEDRRMSRNKAFLAYRHVEKDEKLAALLQRELENYRFSGKIKEKTEYGLFGNGSGSGPSSGKASPTTGFPSRGVGRIFRDTTDLGARADLTEELRRELDNSEYLIVLCSGAAAGSKWIEREIRYFLQSHGPEKILPVLADGDPEEVLPAMFGGIEGMPRHPIACDFRGSRRKALREELPRLAAALLDCPYDELVNRRHRFETRRMAMATSGMILLLSAVIAYYAVMSAQIRRSLREKQIGESESLAVQSETALSQRFRLDAVRHALAALPEEEGDRPVTGQAMLALQKATAAYVPEGSRMLAQTGEFRVPGWIDEFTAVETGGTAYLAAVCAENGEEYALLWNADTARTLYDSREQDGPSGRPSQSALSSSGRFSANEQPNRLSSVSQIFRRKTASIDEEDPRGQSGKDSPFTIMDINLRLDGDMLFQLDTMNSTDMNREPYSYYRLRGVDVRTGEIAWQEYVERDGSCYLLDVQDGVAALFFDGTLPEDPVAGGEDTYSNEQADTVQGEREENGDEEIEKGGENDWLPDSRYQELQLRSTKDGSVLCSRTFNVYQEENYRRYVRAALAGGRGKPAVFIEETYRNLDSGGIEGKEGEAEDPKVRVSMRALDPETGKDRLLLDAGAGRSIAAARKTSDGHVLAVLFARPESPGRTMDNAIKKDPFADETTISYTGAGRECFTVCCADLRTGEILWEEKSSCIHDLNVRLFEDLRIEGKKACALSAGTRVDIFAQDTGERLCSFEFPAMPVCLRTGQTGGEEAVEAVLQDGSRAWCVFPGLEILRTEAVFPGDILSAREAGGKYFFLCSEYPVLASNDRILMFGEDVYDEEVSYAVDSDGKRIPLSRRPFLILSEQGDPVAQISAGGLFVLADSDGTARGVDARTGRTRWEATVGGHDEYVEYVGITGDGSRMVFRDYGPSGEIAFRQSDKEGPSREELWKILRTEDGQIETIRNPEGDLFGGRPCSIIRAAVGGDALTLLASCRKEGKEKEGEEFEYCFLRRRLSDGKTETIYLSSFGEDLRGRKLIPMCFSQSPDGDSTVCTFLNEETESGEPFNLLADWNTRRIAILKDSPIMSVDTAIAYSGAGGLIGLFRFGESPALFARGGEPRQVFQNGDGAENENGTSLRDIGFWGEKLFLLETAEKKLHFRIPQDGTDVLLPAEGLTQYDLDKDPWTREVPVWELPDHKLLLQFRSVAYVFDPAKGDVEAVIDNVAAYNPETDTLLLMDRDNCLAVAPRYSWQELVKKGKRILND